MKTKQTNKLDTKPANISYFSNSFNFQSKWFLVSNYTQYHQLNKGQAPKKISLKDILNILKIL